MSIIRLTNANGSTLALQIDTANNVINAGGTLRVAIARTTGNAACRVFVYGVKRT